MGTTTTSVVLTRAQAWAIASVLNEAGMDVQPRTICRWNVATMQNDRLGLEFVGASGTQVLAAVLTLIRRGSGIGEDLARMDWLVVSFEETTKDDGHFSSLELDWDER